MNVTGAATLGGALVTSVINGYSPALSDSYQIMTFGSVTGSFATETGLVIGGGLVFSPTFGSNNLDLVVSAGAAYTVTTTADSGAGSLREAIVAADASAGGFTINFNIPTVDEAIDVMSTVRWSDDKGVGLQFDGLRARDVWALNKYFEQL